MEIGLNDICASNTRRRYSTAPAERDTSSGRDALVKLSSGRRWSCSILRAAAQQKCRRGGPATPRTRSSWGAGMADTRRRPRRCPRRRWVATRSAGTPTNPAASSAGEQGAKSPPPVPRVAPSGSPPAALLAAQPAPPRAPQPWRGARLPSPTVRGGASAHPLAASCACLTQARVAELAGDKVALNDHLWPGRTIRPSAGAGAAASASGQLGLVHDERSRTVEAVTLQVLRARRSACRLSSPWCARFCEQLKARASDVPCKAAHAPRLCGWPSRRRGCKAGVCVRVSDVARRRHVCTYISGSAMVKFFPNDLRFPPEALQRGAARPHHAAVEV
jgi:hypothetical protein